MAATFGGLKPAHACSNSSVLPQSPSQ